MSTQVDGGPEGSTQGPVGLHVWWDDGVAVLAVRGDLDLAGAGLLAEALAAVLDCERTVVLDLARVGFADVAGLRPIVDAVDRARQQRRSLRVRNLPPSAERLVELEPELRVLRAVRADRLEV